MEIKNYSRPIIHDLEINKYNNFKIAFPNKNLTTTAFLEEIYSYPPKFKVIWKDLDKFNVPKEEAPISFLTRSGKKRFLPFSKKTYSFEDYKNGYLNKTASSTIYRKTANLLNDALQYVPVYTIVNARGEIVVANSNIPYKSNSLVNTIYSFCGSFDSQVSQTRKLGFIFFNRVDAEVYLEEIAKIDPQGTDRVGLSINCIGLNSVYYLMREYHDDIDFRFIPNLSEIDRLLALIKKGNNRLVFDTEQYQAKFAPFKENLLKLQGINEVGEYFKGVPIYIVQVRNTPRNLLYSGILNTFAKIDFVNVEFWSFFDIAGINQRWNNMSPLTDNSLRQSFKSHAVDTYICFDKEQAIELTRKFGRRVKRYAGNQCQTSYIAPLSRRPKILISNLEDFFEFFEESIVAEPLSLFFQSLTDQSQNIYFIPSDESINDLEEFQAKPKRSLVVTSRQFLRTKYKLLVNYCSVLLNNN